MNELLPYEPVLRDHNDSDQEDIQFIEQRLEQHQNDLTGLAAELDTLRRHHRHTLQELPIGLMTLGSDGEILMWNTAMESLTGISSQSVVGSHIRTLQEPWQSLLIHFLEATPSSSLRQECVVNNDTRCMVLHKTADDSQHGTRVVVVEDITETDRLTQELMHSERLASIGRLAAGVASVYLLKRKGMSCAKMNRARTPSARPPATSSPKPSASPASCNRWCTLPTAGARNSPHRMSPCTCSIACMKPLNC